MSVYLHDLLGESSTNGSNVSIPVNALIPTGSCIFVGVSLVSPNYINGTPTVTDNSGNTYRLAASKQVYSAQTLYIWVGFFYAPNCKGVNPKTQITFDFNPTMLMASVVIVGAWASGIVTLVDPLATVKMANSNGVASTKATVSSVVSLTSGDLMFGLVGMGPWSAMTTYVEDTTIKWTSPPFQKFISFDTAVGATGPTIINPNGTGIVTWTPNISPSNMWVAIMCGFKVAGTSPLSAVGYDVGSPEIGPQRFSIFGSSVPRGITVASPFIESPSTNIATPQIVCLTHRDDGVMESLFTNLNVDFTMEVDSNSLVGRFDPDRGQVQRITVQPPLSMGSGSISIDLTGVLGDIPNRVGILEDTVAQLVIQAGGFLQAINNLQDSVSALQSAVVMLQNQVESGTNVNMTAAYMYNLSSPTIDKPVLAVK